MNKPEECQRFEVCGSNLCPLDQDNLESKIWYSDEEICIRQGPKPLWYKNQKKIARKTTNPDIGFFTFDMLNRRIKISKAIKGIDPDRPDEERILIDRWFRLHPDRPKKVMTEKQLDGLRRGRENQKREKARLGALSNTQPQIEPAQNDPTTKGSGT